MRGNAVNRLVYQEEVAMSRRSWEVPLRGCPRSDTLFVAVVVGSARYARFALQVSDLIAQRS
jgi:hypothetical protein